MTRKIQFDDGFIDIEINGDPNRIIKWNPTDINFIDRFMAFLEWVEVDFMDKLSRVSDTVPEKANGNDINKKDGVYFVGGYKAGSMIEVSNEFCEELNKAFGYNISDAVFVGSSPMTMTKTGYTYSNFLDAIAPIIKESYEKNESSMVEFLNKSNKIKKQRVSYQNKSRKRK